MLTPWKKLSSETKFTNRWWKYRFDRVALPSGKEGEYHYVHTPGGVSVVPIDENGRVICVRQYRYPVDRISLEFPGGGVKPYQSHLETAQNELAEETGMHTDCLERIGEFATDAGICDEMSQVFLATGLMPSVLVPDETEEFEIVRLTPQEIEQAIVDGQMMNSFAISTWVIARPHVLAYIKSKIGS